MRRVCVCVVGLSAGRRPAHALSHRMTCASWSVRLSNGCVDTPDPAPPLYGTTVRADRDQSVNGQDDRCQKSRSPSPPPGRRSDSLMTQEEERDHSWNSVLACRNPVRR